ncbi:AMP-binding protein [Streptomyces thinghirensis]|nr:AMP-binding protein [Streptomyces thinghirensis]
MPVNERDDALARAVGLMINMVPVRVALPPDEPFEQLVTRAQRDVSDDLLHSHPFPALARELGHDTPAGRSPVFQTAFVFQDVLDGIADADRPYRLVEELHQEGSTNSPSRCGPAPGATRCTGSTNRSCTATPSSRNWRPASWTSWGRCAKSRVRPWPRCGGGAASGVCRTSSTRPRAAPPDAVAVAGQEEVLTYEALGARSAALASCLVARGVRRGDLVAVLLDRSPDLVVTLLGILKAGAAYVPPRPRSCPRPALTDIVTDSGAPLIVTQARHEARARGLADGGTAAPGAVRARRGAGSARGRPRHRTGRRPRDRRRPGVRHLHVGQYGTP